jgi:hypothetical protein
MKIILQRTCTVLLVCLALAGFAPASAYDAQPKLVVIIIIDQFRGDYLDRVHGQLGQGGFRLFTDLGAHFVNCNYNYANTETGPGHATLFTGAYSDGHGVFANEWWDGARKKMVPVGSDDTVKLLDGTGAGFSPRVLLADTIGDELKLSTDNQSRVFAISLKPRAAVLPGGYTANAAYWVDADNGHWQTSTYYMNALPDWVAKLNASGKAEGYWNQEWKNAAGKVMGNARKPAKAGIADWYNIVGKTPQANDYELEFARDIIEREKLGEGPTTDLLIVSLSANDLLGHALGPNAPQMPAMILATDRQLSSFFSFIGQRIGLANVWLALSSDHGVGPAPEYAATLKLPAADVRFKKLGEQVNAALNARFSPGKNVSYLRAFSVTDVFLNEDAFTAAKIKEEDAEHAAGEALKLVGMRGYYTRSQLARGEVPNTKEGIQYLHSYSPYGGWWVLSVPPPFTVSLWEGGQATHGTPYFYDTHVPVAFFGLPFEPGTYRTHCEPVDMVATLASLLGINAPSKEVGRVLTEALRQPGRSAQ